jgi:hypothetical protein
VNCNYICKNTEKFRICYTGRIKRSKVVTARRRVWRMWRRGPAMRAGGCGGAGGPDVVVPTHVGVGCIRPARGVDGRRAWAGECGAVGGRMWRRGRAGCIRPLHGMASGFVDVHGIIVCQEWRLRSSCSMSESFTSICSRSTR